jgi:chromosome segregation ATPase
MDGFKETTLKGHIQLCELRYRNLEEKINSVEQRITDVETRISNLENKISTFKTEMDTRISTLERQMAQNFSDIKVLLERQNSARTTQLIATAGTIIVAMVGAVSYVLAH